MANVSLAEARIALQTALRDLPALARALENPAPMRSAPVALDAPRPVVWSLALDEIEPTGIDLRPRLPFTGPLDFTGPKPTAARAASAPLSTLLQPITLDPLTVADDADFLTTIANQPNVPEAVSAGLAGLY